MQLSAKVCYNNFYAVIIMISYRRLFRTDAPDGGRLYNPGNSRGQAARPRLCRFGGISAVRPYYICIVCTYATPVGANPFEVCCMEPEKKQKLKRAARTGTDAAAWTIGGVLRLAVKILMSVVLIFVATGLLFTCIFALYVKTSLSTDLDITLSDYQLALSSTIYYADADGQYWELTVLQSEETRFWVDYEDIPQYMEKAAVAIEDKRFYEHKGVDWYRTFGAFVNMFVGMKNDFGGSTITQQLIKNLTEEDDVTVQRKLQEIFRALEFEKTYTKEEIMEWYLNAIYFGEGHYGVGAAANLYFGKDVSELSLAECAAIIGITNNPSLYSPYSDRVEDPIGNNKKRQETILREMYEQGYIDSYEEYIAAVNEKLVFRRGENESANIPIYSYYEEVVIQDVLKDLVEKKGYSSEAARHLLYNGGLKIYACIDMDIQNTVDNIYENTANLPQSWSPSKTQQLQSACVILDPYTGDIKALSGGVGEKTINYGWNYATDAKRSPGSSIKPLTVYGPALDLGLITQTTLVNDAGPDEVQLRGTSWYPANAERTYSGIITIREALRLSKNTVAAQIVDKLTPQTSYDYLTKKLGVTSTVEYRVTEDGRTQSDVGYAPMALGALTDGITVREMAQAFDAFPNDGVFTYSRSYSRIEDANGNLLLDNVPDTVVAFKANTARNITDMLTNAVAWGTGTAASFSGQQVAGKTGTGTDNTDRYFVGYTGYYVCAVWCGYDTPERMYFYSNPSCQIFKSIMQSIHENLEYKAFPAPVIGGPTNIFGDLEETPTPSPEETETPSPEVTDTPSPSPSDTETPTPSVSPSADPATPTPSASETQPPVESGSEMPPDTAPPIPSVPVEPAA